MLRLVAIAGFLAALGAAGCHRAPAPGGAAGSKPDAARKQAETLALNAVQAAADAQLRANPALAEGAGLRGGRGTIRSSVQVAANTTPPLNPNAAPSATGSQTTIITLEPKAAPRPGPAPIVKERVISTLAYPNEADAEKDAINAACDLVQQRFAELDPPLRYRPTPNEMLNEFLRRDSRTVRPLDAAERDFFASKGITGNLVRVEYDVEVSANQVRALRTRERVSATLRVFGALTAVALAGFLFLRADEWTKGYLTRWLAAAAVLLAGGAAAALYFV